MGPSTAGSAPARAAVEDAQARKKVSREDCARWAKHGSEVAIRDIEAAFGGCPPDVRSKALETMNGQAAAILSGAEATCQRHLDAWYLAGQADCYLSTTRYEDLAACKLAPMATPDDTDPKALIEGTRAKCASLAAAPGASGP